MSTSYEQPFELFMMLFYHVSLYQLFRDQQFFKYHQRILLYKQKIAYHTSYHDFCFSISHLE